MSNEEGFIDEVTEAVRRDRLFALFRRYGWIGIAAIILIVGYSAWSEWREARAATAAQAFGDAILAAAAAPTPDERTAAFDAIATTSPEQAALLALLRAAEPGAEGALVEAAKAAGLPQVWAQVVEFKYLTADVDLPADERRSRLAALETGPMRVLAAEQLALLDLAEGKRAEALARLTALTEDSETSQSMRERISRLIVALGGSVGGTGG